MPSLDIWEIVMQLCSPVTQFRLALTCRRLLRKYNAKDRFGSFEFNPFDNAQPGCGFMSAEGLSFRQIEAFDFQFVCRNDDGMDLQQQNMLMLLDDYWKQRCPPDLRYESFITDATGELIICRGCFPKDRYQLVERIGYQGDDEGILDGFDEGAHCATDAKRGYEWITWNITPLKTSCTFRAELQLLSCAYHHN